MENKETIEALVERTSKRCDDMLDEHAKIREIYAAALVSIANERITIEGMWDHPTMGAKIAQDALLTAGKMRRFT